MKKFILTIVIFIFVSNGHAQSPIFQWAKQFGGKNIDKAYSITLDSHGNIYITGFFSDTADFDPGVGTFHLVAKGTQDLFVTKLDNSGNLIWAKQIGGTNTQMNSDNNDQGHNITIDEFDNIYVIGDFIGIVDFDPGIDTSYLYSNFQTSVNLYDDDSFILKLNSFGNFVWAKQIGGLGPSHGMGISTFKNSVYITGSYTGTVDFDPDSMGVFNLSCSGNNANAFVEKLDDVGNFIWVKQFAGTNHTFANSIAVDKNGYIYTTGSFNGTSDFDPNNGLCNYTTIGISYQAFVSKLDSLGGFIWAKRFVGYGEAYSITLDSFANVYTTGKFSLTTDFDPNTGTYNLSDSLADQSFISKLDSSGNFVWAKQTYGANLCYGNSLLIDTLGSVYTIGFFTGTTDFDPGTATFYLTPNGTSNVYILKLDSIGNFLWAGQMGRSMGQSAYKNHSIALDSFGNIYSAGGFVTISGTYYQTDFDPGLGTYYLSSFGNVDAYVFKLSQCLSTDLPINTTPTYNMEICSGKTTTLSANGYGSIEWYNMPTGGNILSIGNNFNTPVLTNNTSFYVSGSCTDTTVRTLISVSVLNTNTNISISDSTITAQETAASYQWIDCSNGNNPIVGATNQSYSATANGSYAVIVTKGICSDTSICLSIENMGLNQKLNSNYINIYPNPTSGFINIEMKKSHQNDYKISIVNVAGQIVYEEKISINTNEFSKQIDAKNLPQGIYLIQLTNDGNKYSKRIVKN